MLHMTGDECVSNMFILAVADGGLMSLDWWNWMALPAGKVRTIAPVAAIAIDASTGDFPVCQKKGGMAALPGEDEKGHELVAGPSTTYLGCSWKN